MLKVTKNGRVRSINEQDLANHKQMGWSMVDAANTAEKTKTKTIKSVELEVHADVLDETDDDLTPTEEK